MSVVERLFEEHQALHAYLSGAGELSLLTSADENSRKSLVLAAASYFEHVIRSLVFDLCAERTRNDELVLSLIKQKAIDRQYHTYFDWDQKNANRFFALFGSAFANHMKKRVREKADLHSSVVAFLELGSLRNQLVHRDFATFPMEKTVDETYDLYQRAQAFVDAVTDELRMFDGAPKGGGTSP